MIEVVLLDIGGVLVELGGVPGLQRLLGSHLTADDIHDLWAQSVAVLLHETGRIDAEAFAAHAVTELRIPLSPSEFLTEFARWPIALHDGANELVRAIPARYNTSALSNISDIHWSRIGGELGLDGAFQRHYFSHELGYMKPDPRIYDAVLTDLGVAPGRVLFIDDSPRNVAAARAAGIDAHLAADTAAARVVLQTRGILSPGS